MNNRNLSKKKKKIWRKRATKYFYLSVSLKQATGEREEDNFFEYIYSQMIGIPVRYVERTSRLISCFQLRTSLLNREDFFVFCVFPRTTANNRAPSPRVRFGYGSRPRRRVECRKFVTPPSIGTVFLEVLDRIVNFKCRTNSSPPFCGPRTKFMPAADVI